MTIFCYQHHINDWRTKTAGLSLEEKGAYRELMDWFYALEGRLPSDQERLCRILGVQTQSERTAIAYITQRFWSETMDGFLTQSRAAEELEKIKTKSIKASKSAQSKYNKDLDSANAERTQSERTANQEPRTKNQEPLLKEDSYGELNMAVSNFNELADRIGLPRVQKLSETRKKHLSARLKDCGGLDGWKAALKRAEAIPAFRGGVGNGWKADFDFLVKESSFTKLMEGKYDGWGTSRKESDSERHKRELQEWVDGR